MKLPTVCVTPDHLRARPELIAELRANPGQFTERRVAPVEFRDSDGPVIVGHAAVFNDLSGNLGGFRERIDRGAFRKVLRDDPDVFCLLNHDPNLILGRTHAGNLTLKEDGTGLAYEVEPTDTDVAERVMKWIGSGEITQSSFAFRVADDSWDEDEETGGLIRTIHEFSALFDVSPVTYPAYPTADVGLRSLSKLASGVSLTEEERAEIDALLHPSDEPSVEQDAGANGQEPGVEATDEGRSDDGVTETLDGLSPVAARLRISERIARL